MYEYTNESSVPVKIWSEEGSVEQGAIDQINNLAKFPFAYHHIAIMPDTHQGYGMPIGGVMATDGVILPNAVGVDIGCGMCAVKTDCTDLPVELLKEIMGEIREIVPVGFNHQEKKQDESLLPKGEEGEQYPIVSQERANALSSIGTLGGGNHFIEIQRGSDNHIWVMIHSGSRNLGKQVADHYNKVAIDMNEKMDSHVPKEWELAFLSVNSEEGKLYLREMQYCVDFALANRKLMMDNIINILSSKNINVLSIDGKNMINIAHNYAALEKHFGRDVWVHRKGATLATSSTVGIIPGSQGTHSFIVVGKGNPESFTSCSHGSGRKMGRKQAQRTLNLEEEKKRLDDLGIVHAIRGVDDLDEASGAYKDIDVVMRNQEDLVGTLVELKPLGVIKG